MSTKRTSYPVLQSTTFTKELEQDIPHCTENEHVAFLKTYKTGSETISGILRRFALLRNLSSAISVGPGGTNRSSFTVISRDRANFANLPFDIAQLII